MSNSISSATWALLVLSWLFVCLRCGVRIFLVKSFGFDDWLMLLSQIAYTIWGICLLLGVHAGMGHHMAELTPERIMQAMKYWYICGGLYCFVTTLVKVAVGFFLLRVIVHPVQKYVIWGTLAVSTGYGIFMIVGTLAQCDPPQKFWDNNIDGSCGNRAGGVWTGYVHAAISAAVDFIMAGIPFFMLRHSNLGWKKRVAIYLIMSLGSYAAITTLIRASTIDDLTKSGDYLYNITSITIWSWVEPGVGIIAACMATLRPLVRVVFERTGISKSGSKTRSTTARFDPDVNLDELRGESGVTVTNIEARESPSPERTPNGGKRRRSSTGGESGNSESGWQSFGSQEHVLQSNTRIKRSVQVTISTSDAADLNEIQSVRSPMGVKRVL
ncbi:Polytopic membrane protein [Lasiodiplodia theobromae]|uniref:Polytopic membrane protein n=1 Tax=Lasiodiplodia theobromae TaxID=45133 RepID=UPI0015C4080F|nr:Polytopic membrane protein [Lasiodiplodia theobromae]KAF4543408.1 Polytopic membrane protein [Lasiodiplodia theobromae]